MRRVNEAIGSIALIVLQPIIFYWHILIFPREHIPYDVESYYFPLIAYIARCIRNGWAPFWDPYTYAGMPLHADLQAQMFYPPTWIAIALGNVSQGRNLFYWVEWLDPLHLILAGVFLFLLLRRMGLCHPAALLGATVYQLGGYFASQATHLGAIGTAAWLPLSVLAAFELRRRFRPRGFAVMILATALSILSGFAATTLVVAGATTIFVLAMIAWREASWRLLPTVAAAFAIAALVAAVQLVPLWQLTSLSIASIRSSFTPAWGTPLQSLMSLIVPDYYHIFEPFTRYKLPFNWTLLYVYCGIVPLLLFLAVPFLRPSRGWMFFTLTVASAFWMLGENTPVYGLVFNRLPGLLRGALYAWYAMMAFCFFAGITAAIGLDHVAKRVPEAFLWIIVLFTSWDLIRTGRDRPMNSTAGSYKLSSSEYQYGSDPEALQTLHALVNTSIPPMRIDYADAAAPGILAAAMLELPTADGNIPFMLRRMFLLRRLFSNGSYGDRILPVTRFDSPLLRMLNIGVLAGLYEISGSGLQRAGSVGGLYLYKIPAPLPRFFLVRRIRSSSGELETFQLLARPDFDPAAEAIVEGIPSGRVDLATGTLGVSVYEPDRIELSVLTSGPAFLATSEPLYPGWEATVNGRKQPMLMTNGVFRGLELTGGKSDVTMIYRPSYLMASAVVSMVALLATIAIGIRGDSVAMNRDRGAA
jgi:hypothetical protein